MSSLSVKARLSLAIGVMTLLLMVVVMLSLTAMSNANGRLESFVNGVNARARLASDVGVAVGRRAIAARNLVLVKRPEDLAQEKEAVTQAHHEVGEKLSQLKEAVSAPGIPDNVRSKVAEIDAIERQYGPGRKARRCHREHG